MIASALASSRAVPLAYCASALLVVFVYLPSLSLYFAGGDNFDEIAVARFIDSAQPSRVFTEPAGGYRYRPLDRATNLVTATVGGFNPLPFRLRNTLAHVCASIVFGLVLASLVNRSWVGPVGALLFGLQPGNELTVGLAITTKTLFGLFFFLTCLLWIRMWKTRKRSVGSWLLLLLLTVVTIFYHEEGISLLALALFMGLLLWASSKRTPETRRDSIWLLYGGSLSVVGAALFLWSRAQAQVPTFGPIWSQGARYGAAAAVSLFTPIDFMLLFGRSVVTSAQGSIGVLSRPMNYAAPLAVLLAGMLAVLALLVCSAVHFWRTRDWRPLCVQALLVASIPLTLVPVLLMTRTAYSEVYNYVPVAFVIALLVIALTPSLYVRPPRLVRSYGLAVLGLLALSFAAGTLNRHILLSDVAAQTREVVETTGRLVPNPQKGAQFLYMNEPGIATDAGYSIYAFQGAGTLEEAAGSAVRLLYSRFDLDATLLRDPGTLPARCQAIGPGHPVYLLEWRDAALHLLGGGCKAMGAQGPATPIRSHPSGPVSGTTFTSRGGIA